MAAARATDIFPLADDQEVRLAEQIVVGDPARVTRERVVADLERIKQELIPGHGPTVDPPNELH
jgi:hypothetical protein